MVRVLWGRSFCRHLRHGGARAVLVDDGLALGEGGQQGLDGRVVDRPGVAAAGLRFADKEGREGWRIAYSSMEKPSNS